MPCVPYAGPDVGFFAIPPEKANVWVEFEGGDPDYPIWSGCFLGPNEIPAIPPAQPGEVATVKVLKTETASVMLDDKAQSLTIRTGDKKIALTKDEIEITNGKGSVKLIGAMVSINGDALEVT